MSQTQLVKLRRRFLGYSHEIIIWEGCCTPTELEDT